MVISPTPLEGLMLVEPELRKDARGWFSRAWCREEFLRAGIAVDFCQCNLSQTAHKGTVRGLHYQRPPHQEDKLVRCVQGSVYDVAVDVRPGSPSFGRCFATELSAENACALFIPKGFAHGFQSLTDSVSLFYQVSAIYSRQAEGGLLWSDSDLSIPWPLPLSQISEKDASLPKLKEIFA